MSILKNSSSKGLLLLISAQVMVGLNIVAAKMILPSITMTHLLALRFLTAAVLLYLLHICTPAGRQKTTFYLKQLHQKDWLYLVLQALFAGVLFNCLMLWGLSKTDANVAGIITSVLPTVIAIFSWLILKEPLTQRSLFAILLACSGLAVMASSQLTHLSSSHSFFGDAIVLLSLFPEAAYYVVCKMHRIQLPIFLMSAIINAINGLIIALIAVFVHQQSTHFDLSVILVLLILGTTSGLFYVFWYYGCQTVEGMLASLTTAVMPLASVFLAWLFLGEGLTLTQVAGMGLVIGSIVFYA